MFALIHCEISYSAENKTAPHIFVASASAGVYSAKFHRETGQLTEIKQVENKYNGYFITKHPSLDILYLAERLALSSRIHTYRIREEGRLQHIALLENLPEGIAHISTDAQGKKLAAAYYKSSHIGIYEISDDGEKLKVYYHNKHSGKSVDERQQEPHPHWSGFSPDGQYVYFTDLGTDQIWVYKLNAQHNPVELIQKSQAPIGSGPRHIAVNRVFNTAYVSDELAARVSIYNIKTNGELHYVASTKTQDALRKEAWFNVSDIKLHPKGDFLYLVNRGFDQVSVFKVNQDKGSLTFVENEPIRGSISRHIELDSSGDWALVLGNESNTLSVFNINQHTGELIFAKPVYAIPAPMAMVWE